ncbi:hypothetical protein IHE44_0009842 [Lamprotornis superbus]|uniref:small monomeric GTPase n=1 Tax=Lamprotornis superbus TaxID=245042 RepID=A0A835NE66_9PASS|nr:hypothetical protein IHE44_0009842 [Lamprotornis superbus]
MIRFSRGFQLVLLEGVLLGQGVTGLCCLHRDTAGQERFHTITTSYYRGAMGIMLVYDITNAKSFENISKWLRNIDEHANEDVERMLLGNKCDMEDKRVVPKAKGEQIAREHGIRFFETSAKANINIEKAFLTLAEDILRKTPVKEPNSENVDISSGVEFSVMDHVLESPYFSRCIRQEPGKTHFRLESVSGVSLSCALCGKRNFYFHFLFSFLVEACAGDIPSPRAIES